MVTEALDASHATNQLAPEALNETIEEINDRQSKGTKLGFILPPERPESQTFYPDQRPSRTHSAGNGILAARKRLTQRHISVMWQQQQRASNSQIRDASGHFRPLSPSPLAGRATVSRLSHQYEPEAHTSPPVQSTIPVPFIAEESPWHDQRLTLSYVSQRDVPQTAPEGATRYSSSQIGGNASGTKDKKRGKAEPPAAAEGRGWKKKVLARLNSRAYFVFLIAATLYVIFENDVSRACLPAEADVYLQGGILFLLAVFVFDICISSFVRPAYFLGFYFWLDSVATASLFFGFPVLEDMMNHTTPLWTSLDKQNDLFSYIGNRAYLSSTAGRAARIFQIMRMLWQFRMYMQFEVKRRMQGIPALRRNGSQDQGKDIVIEGDVIMGKYGETRIGQKLEELFMRRIIVGVMIMTFILPCFDVPDGLWGQYLGVDQGGLRMMHDMAVASGNNTVGFLVALQAYQMTVSFKLGTRNTSDIFYLIIKNTTYVPLPASYSRRFDELFYDQYFTTECPYAPPSPLSTQSGTEAFPPFMPFSNGQPLPPGEECITWWSFVVYDWKWYSQVTSILNILRNLFIITLLFLAALFVNRDTRILVLTPIERMMNRLAEIAENPLAHVLHQLHDRYKLSPDDRNLEEVPVLPPPMPEPPQSVRKFSRALSSAAVRAQYTVVLFYRRCIKVIKAGWARLCQWTAVGWNYAVAYFFDDVDQSVYETRVLANSMNKIAALLAVGFGDAGAEVIAENITNEGDINPMVPGKNMVAVFGFCDIRRFTDTTEVLQEQVMEFVNSIAHIVHSVVAAHRGAANKNIGDAFLLVWKFPEGVKLADIKALAAESRGATPISFNPYSLRDPETSGHSGDRKRSLRRTITPQFASFVAPSLPASAEPPALSVASISSGTHGEKPSLDLSVASRPYSPAGRLRLPALEWTNSASENASRTGSPASVKFHSFRHQRLQLADPNTLQPSAASTLSVMSRPTTTGSSTSETGPVVRFKGPGPVAEGVRLSQSFSAPSGASPHKPYPKTSWSGPGPVAEGLRIEPSWHAPQCGADSETVRCMSSMGFGPGFEEENVLLSGGITLGKPPSMSGRRLGFIAEDLSTQPSWQVQLEGNQLRGPPMRSHSGPGPIAEGLSECLAWPEALVGIPHRKSPFRSLSGPGPVAEGVRVSSTWGLQTGNATPEDQLSASIRGKRSVADAASVPLSWQVPGEVPEFEEQLSGSLRAKRSAAGGPSPSSSWQAPGEVSAPEDLGSSLRGNRSVAGGPSVSSSGQASLGGAGTEDQLGASLRGKRPVAEGGSVASLWQGPGEVSGPENHFNASLNARRSVAGWAATPSSTQIQTAVIPPEGQLGASLRSQRSLASGATGPSSLPVPESQLGASLRGPRPIAEGASLVPSELYGTRASMLMAEGKIIRAGSKKGFATPEEDLMDHLQMNVPLPPTSPVFLSSKLSLSPTAAAQQRYLKAPNALIDSRAGSIEKSGNSLALVDKEEEVLRVGSTSSSPTSMALVNSKTSMIGSGQYRSSKFGGYGHCRRGSSKSSQAENMMTLEEGQDGILVIAQPSEEPTTYVSLAAAQTELLPGLTPRKHSNNSWVQHTEAQMPFPMLPNIPAEEDLEECAVHEDQEEDQTRMSPTSKKERPSPWTHFLLPFRFRTSSRVQPAEESRAQGGSQQMSIKAKLASVMSSIFVQPIVGFVGSRPVSTPLTPPPQTPLTWEDKRAGIQCTADNALASFVLIHAALRRSRRLKQYAENPDLLSRMPGFKVEMGFGLHVGWAIEGPIGSEFKVDASYLGPSVNIASRLEAATKQFGVSLLLSQDFVACLSPRVYDRVRQIDCVTVKGSKLPIGLYAYDIDVSQVKEPDLLENSDSDSEDEHVWRLWEDEWSQNPDLADTWGIDLDFKSKFDYGFEYYISGEWSNARTLLESCRMARCNAYGSPLLDRPTEVLLDFMESHGWVAPANWTGCRELTEK